MSTLNRNRMIAGLSYALAFIVYVPINFGSSTPFPPLVAAFWGALLGHSLIMDYEKKRLPFGRAVILGLAIPLLTFMTLGILGGGYEYIVNGGGLVNAFLSIAVVPIAVVATFGLILLPGLIISFGLLYGSLLFCRFKNREDLSGGIKKIMHYKWIIKIGLLAVIALFIGVAIAPEDGISAVGGLQFIWSFLYHQIVEKPFAGVEDFKQAGIAGGIILISLSLLLYGVFLVFYISIFLLCQILLKKSSVVVAKFFHDHPVSSSVLTLVASLWLSFILWPLFIHIWVFLFKYVFIVFVEFNRLFNA